MALAQAAASDRRWLELKAAELKGDDLPGPFLNGQCRSQLRFDAPPFWENYTPHGNIGRISV
jgi:hypothetical protein